jgi:2-isopropylmalate synthase
LEEIAMVLYVRRDRYSVKTGICHEEIYSTSQLLAKILGFEPQPNKAIVGRNAFAHEAGMHQHGVLSNPLCYEIMTPETVGVPPNRIVLGKHSGRRALAHKFEEMGYELSVDAINRIYHEFVRLADSKKHIYEQDLLSILFAGCAEIPAS